MQSVKCPDCLCNFYREKAIINIENEFVCPHCEYSDSDFLVFETVRKPDKLPFPDITKISNETEKLITRSLESELTDDAAFEVYAVVMETIYGEEIWEWLEKNPHEFNPSTDNLR